MVDETKMLHEEILTIKSLRAKIMEASPAELEAHVDSVRYSLHPRPYTHAPSEKLGKLKRE